MCGQRTARLASVQLTTDHGLAVIVSHNTRYWPKVNVASCKKGAQQDTGVRPDAFDVTAGRDEIMISPGRRKSLRGEER